MNKTELVALVAEKTGLTKTAASDVIDATFEGVEQSLKKGEDIAIHGFGIFKHTERAARDGRNPITGEALKIAAKKGVKFAPSKTLKDALNIPKKKK